MPFLRPALCVLLLCPVAPAAEFMFAAKVDGRLIEGRPLDWTDSVMTLLGRDGQLHEFDPRIAKEATKTAPQFKAYSTNEMRNRLLDEFDGRLDVTTAQHYLVLHPKGEQTAWANRFESLYNAFVSYVRVRGFPVHEPPFPLVAVVFRNQQEYNAHVQQSGAKVLPNSLGFYSHSTNRILLFDITGGDRSQDWSDNADTIIHEATHQAAFNLGVHSRTSPPPYWVPEGLATMFEARGVWRPGASDTRADRVNHGYLDEFRRYAKKNKPPFSIQEFVASDTPFKRNTGAAYAQAWALSFYLSETQPRNYSRHLAATADRPVYSAFSSLERLRYFRDAFGKDLAVLEANFVRWIAQL